MNGVRMINKWDQNKKERGFERESHGIRVRKKGGYRKKQIGDTNTKKEYLNEKERGFERARKGI